MISGTTGAPVASAGLDRGLEDRARLHLGDLGIGDRQAAAAVAEHRVELVQLRGARASACRPRRPSPSRPRAISASVCGRNSCSGGSSRRIVTGRPRHDLEQLDEVRALHRQQLGERRAAARLVVGEDHLAHRDDAVALEEHVLGAAEADALGAEVARRARRRAACRRWRAPSCGATSSAQPISVAKSPDSSGSSIGTCAHAAPGRCAPSMVMMSPFLSVCARRPSASAPA